MLSMNSSTSWPSSSRKYSAIVSADRPTRSRVPGGSSICPKTRAVSLITPESVISRNRSLPSRVRSPTPAKTETPWNCFATRVIISWISTVLPTPAPPNRPILPPRTYGVSRSSTLIPVSRISVLGSSWSNGGGSRWIPHRHRYRPAGVGDRRVAGQAVGRLHGDGPDHVVADVLLHLEGERSLLAAEGHVHVQGVVDAGDLLGRELHVDDGTDHLDYSAGAGAGASALGGGAGRACGHGVAQLPEVASASALAPPTISLISWVISACLALLASRLSCSISSLALSVADFMARRREAISAAAASSSAWKIRLSTYHGSSASSTPSGDGSNS